MFLLQKLFCSCLLIYPMRDKKKNEVWFVMLPWQLAAVLLPGVSSVIGTGLELWSGLFGLCVIGRVQIFSSFNDHMGKKWSVIIKGEG